MQTTQNKTLCPRCQAKLTECTAISGNPSEFWLECPNCNTYVNTYEPMTHQRGVHTDSHRFIGNFGGYGTGKTTTTRQEIIKHLLITPNANVVVGANVSSQYEQTIKRELENDLPRAFVKSYSVKNQYMDLLNGARLMWRSFDDPGKLRSLNLTMFVIIEGSETSAEIYHQLKTRLRNRAAAKPLLDENGKPVFVRSRTGKEVPADSHDWRKGIIESNPDSGYIRTDILLVSDKINQYGEVSDEYHQDTRKQDPQTSSHVASSSVNKYLPADFIPTLVKNKPSWWVLRYLFGSFQFSEGLVYPTAMQCIIEDFEIPKNWLRLVAHDYGLSDQATFVYGAIDPIQGRLIIYKAAFTRDMNVDKLHKLYLDTSSDIPEGGYFTQPIIDPKSGPKRDYNKKTLSDHYLEKGLYFKPGHVNLDARILRTNTYFESGKLKIFESCVDLIEELKGYKFPEKSLDATTAHSNKPIDKNNHGINPVEWICMELPANPDALIHHVYNRRGQSVSDFGITDNPAETPLVPWQFTDDSDDPFYNRPDQFDNDGFNMLDMLLHRR